VSDGAVARLRTLKPTMSALARRPDLWPVALRSARHLAPRQWWRRRPFLPVPDDDWIRFRLITAYGGDGSATADEPVPADDVIVWLEWMRDWPHHSAHRSR